MSFSPETGLVYIPDPQAELHVHARRRLHALAADHESWHPPGRRAGGSGAQAAATAGDAGQRRRPAHRVGSRRAARGVARRARGRGQWRRAVHGGRPRVSGDRHRRVHGARRQERYAALVGPDADGRDRRADLLHGRRRAIRRDHGRHRRVVGDVRLAEPTPKGTACPTSPACSSTRSGARRRFPRPSRDRRGRSRRRPRPRSAATVARGEAEYRTYCGRCHGPDGAANFGILPDLRYSAALQSSEAWAAVVLEGRDEGQRHGVVRAGPRRERGRGHSRLRHRAGERRATAVELILNSSARESQARREQSQRAFVLYAPALGST